MNSLNSPLQVGSNIFELIEFTVSDKAIDAPMTSEASNPTAITSYGVNVSKVKEVIRLPQIIPCLTTTKDVVGVINLRGSPIPVINLAHAIGYKDEKINPNYQVIITEFANRVAGFIVSGTKRIRRVAWDKVLPPVSDTFHMITGMLPVENSNFIFILDFERILLEIENSHGGSHGTPALATSSNTSPYSIPGKPVIMVVDDSATARKAVIELLRSMGCEIIDFANGELAYQHLLNNGASSHFGNIKVILSDIEMPKLDGYSLIKKIRENEKLRHMPVILHSSLSGQANKEKSKAAGADACVGKLNKKEIYEAICQMLK